MLTNHQNSPKTITVDYYVAINYVYMKCLMTWGNAYGQVKANHQNRKL